MLPKQLNQKNDMKKALIMLAALLFATGVGCQKNVNPRVEKPVNNNVVQSRKTAPGLEKIDISHRLLTKIPSLIFDHTNAGELNVSYNNLTGAIPAEIRHLSKLKILNMSNNQLTGLPAELGQLQDLEILDVSNNKLTGLPLELGNLKKLKKFVISGNKYSNDDLTKIREMIPQAEIIDETKAI